jgi:general secretion pathway protein M
MIARWQDNVWLRRAVFAGVNAAAAALVVGALVLPACDFFAARDARIAEQRALLARLQGVVAQEARIQAMAGETDAQAQAGEFLRGANEGVVSADLQTRLKTVAEGAGARLRSVQALPANTRDEIRYIGSRMELTGSIQAIQRTIHAVESGKPYLFVTAATIKSSPMMQQAASAQEPVVDAQLDLYGAVQPEGRDG